MGKWRESRRNRWRTYAFLARHGNQQIIHLLGRQPTVPELRIFVEEIADLVRREPYVKLG